MSIILTIASFATCLYLAGWVSVRILRASSHSFDRWCTNNLQPSIKNIEALLFLLVLVFVGLPTLPFLAIVFLVRFIRGYIALRKSDNSPQELDKLAEYKSAFVRRAVIQNPNTSPETLLKLGKDFPRELLQNPVFPLMLLSDPDLLQTMPRGTLASLLKLNEIPVGYLEQAAAIPNLGLDLARIIAKHPRASSQALQQIAAYSYDLEIGQAVLKRSSGDTAVLETLARYGHQDIQLYLAKRFNLPQSVFNSLAEYGREAVWLYLAQQPTTSTETLERLARRFFRNAEIARAIVQHPNISEAALQQLAKQSYSLEVGQALLERRGLSQVVLENLARYGHQRIQLDLARQQHLAAPVFENLVEYGHDQVRLYLAQQPNVSVEVLERLAQKGDTTQIYLAQQKQLPESVLNVLVQFGKANVRLYLAQHHSLPHDSLEFLAKREPAVQFHLARQPDLSPDILKLLAIHGNSAVQQLLLQRSDLTLAVLVRLAKCGHPHVQLLVEQKLALLAPDRADAVLLTLAEHGGKRIQLFLFNRLQIYNQPELLLNKLVEQGHRKVKLYIAQQPHTPTAALEKLSTDARASVRRFVALNPSTPLSSLKQLAADSDLQVSQTALQKLSERGEGT